MAIFGPKWSEGFGLRELSWFGSIFAMAREYILRIKSTSLGVEHTSVYNKQMRGERDLDTLIGICKGILFDGKVTDAELDSLNDWLKNHPDALHNYLGEALFERLKRIKSDGVVTDEERSDIDMFMRQAVGDDPAVDRSSIVFIDDPAPFVEIPDRKFCFTGNFLSGSRKWCESEVVKRAGLIQSSVSSFTDYLVVGSLASKDWKHTNSGTKIDRALQLKPDGRIHIIVESHWLKYLDETPMLTD